MRITRRKAFVIIGIALIAGSLLLITSSPFQQWLLRRAESFASKAGFPFSATRLRLDLTELKASLDGFSYDQNGQQIRVERLQVDFPWNALRDGGLRITSLEADHVAVSIRSSELSASAPATREPARAPPPRIRIDRLAVRDVALTYSTPATVLKIPSMSVEAAGGRGVIRFDAPATVGPSSVTLGQLPFELDDAAVRFGPAPWMIRYTTYEGSGSAQGVVRWSPSLALDADVITDPISIESWKDIRLNAKLSYRDGALDVSEFHISQGDGEVHGSARRSEAGTSANLSWRNWSLAPSGVAHTDGTLTLAWTAADVSDLAGEGRASVKSRQYGNAETVLRIADQQATFDIRASAMDLAIRARLVTGLNQVLAGNFKEFSGKVRGTLQPQTTSTLYQKLSTVDISATGLFRDNALTFRDIEAKSKGSFVSGATLQASLTTKQIRGKIPRVRIAMVDVDPALQGSVDLSADIAGSIDQPTAAFTAFSAGLDYRSAHIDNVRLVGMFSNRELRGALNGTLHPVADDERFGPINVSATAALQDNVLTVSEIEAKSRNSVASMARLQVSLGDKHLDGKIPMVEIDLRDFRPDLHGTLGLSADIAGTIDQPTAIFTGFSNGVDLGGTHIDKIAVEGKFADNSIRVTRLEAHQGDGILGVNGSVSLDTEAVHGEAKVSDLRINQVEGLGATAFLNAKLGGTYRAPLVDFEGELRNVVYRQEEHGTLAVEGTANPKEASFRANSEKYSANVAGEISFEQPYAFTADLTSTQSRIRYQKYEVVADGRVRVSGQAEPFKTNQIDFDKFTLHGEGVELSADGSMNTGTRVNIKADLSELPIEGVDLEGKAQVLATLTGSVNDPSIEGELTTDGAKVRVMEMKEAADVSAKVDFTGHDLSIRDLHATLAGATATITGRGSWQGTGQLQFRVANLRPENFAPGRQISGVAGVEGQVDIKSPDLEGISGSAKITELQMKIRGVDIHQTAPIEAEVQNHVLTVRHFEIEGLDTHASITGHADLLDRTLNLDADADTDLVILEPFIPNSHPSGRIKSSISLRGTMEQPSFDGFVRISGGELAIERPDILLSRMDVEAQLRGDRVELSRASGTLNGGTFQASGGTGLSASGLRDAAFQVNVERGQLEYPEGLQAEFSSQLKIDGSTPTLTLSGSVDVLNAIYEKDFNLTQAVFARIASPQSALNTAATGGTSDLIRMEVEVRTPESIYVKNNVADLQATGSFRIRGTVANPIILGRARVLEGGELYFGPTIDTQTLETNRRSDRYAIENGSIDFNNPLRTEPELDFVATHELEVKDERYVVTLKVTGTPATLKAELTSDPPEDQSDIVAMLLTGRTVHELQGTYANFAGEQALGYVSGQLSERFLSQAGDILGLNMVRVDPVTVANQTDLAARLTIAKDITTEFSLVYSQYLNSAKAQTWIASYHPLDNFVLRGINDAEQNEVVIDFKHDLRFGGGTTVVSRTRPRNETKLRKITFNGSQFAAKDLKKKVTKAGNPFGSYRVSQDVRNLRRYLASQGYPKARIEAQQNSENGNVDVRFDIAEGPKIELGYEGATVPEDVQSEVQQIWTMRPSDAASLRDSISRLLRHFRSEGYLQAQISSEPPSSNSGDRRYVFKIDPGYEFSKPAWLFNGIEPMEIHEPAGLVMESPEDVQERIESYWRGNGYLDVKSSVPKLVIEGTNAHFEVNVDRGSPYTVERIEFEGNREFDAEKLRGFIPAETSKEKEKSSIRFTSAWLETARQKITSEYWKQGYNDVQVVPSTSSNASLALSTVRFAIIEGESQRIDSIEITGDSLTSRKYIERQFQFKKGDPLDYTKINLTRKKLYDLRVFRRVEIEVAPGTTGNVAHVRLTESAPWRLSYGVAVTEHLETGDKQVGLGTDLSYNNLFGRSITTGFSAKVNADERDGRVFGSVPQFFGRPVTTSLTFFRTRDLTDPEDIVDYWGTTIQQQWKLREHYLFSYDYSYRKVLRGERDVGRAEDDPDSILDDPRVPLARFGTTISRDTRDDILNATRGTFLSNSFEIAPPGIGSSVEFLRNYSQYFRYQSVKKFVLASAVRFGVAKPFKGQEMDPTLQFEAGGGTTVRAFKQDELTREPGNYEFILNQELRFPLFWKFSGVTFVDAGQITNRSENLFRFRYGPGVGIRIQTPFVLLRTDLGINVQQRPGEARARWAFGIGQAF